MSDPQSTTDSLDTLQLVEARTASQIDRLAVDQALQIRFLQILAEKALTVFAGGKANRYWSEVESARDGCLRNIGSRKDDRFVCVPIGIRGDRLEVEARQDLKFTAHHPVTGKMLKSAAMRAGERLTLPSAGGALIVVGRIGAE